MKNILIAGISGFVRGHFVHHLALGNGLGFNHIVQVLSIFTNKYLLVEFVARDDKLITAEPTFSPAFHSDPNEFGWYTLDNFIQVLQTHFLHIKIERAYPDSRIIAICEN